MEEDKKVCYCIGSVCVYSGMKCRKYEDDVKLDNEEETKKILKKKIEEYKFTHNQKLTHVDGCRRALMDAVDAMNTSLLNMKIYEDALQNIESIENVSGQMY